MPGALEHDAGEMAGGKCAGVNADSVGLNLGLADRWVAMDNDGAMVGGAIQENLADPQQVGGLLGVKCHTGADSGVNK